MVSGIGSVSSLGSAFSTSCNQSLSAQTRLKLESLGIDTKNIKTETEAQEILKLYQSNQNTQGVNSSQNTDQANKVSTLISQQPNQGQLPAWISLMELNGISPTGSIDGDKAAVKSALAKMDPEQAKSLASQFQAVGLPVEATNDSQQNNTMQADAFAGQNQLAEMNKFFLLNKTVV
jgi:hypothetical protein